MRALYQQLVQDHINLSRVLKALRRAVADYNEDDWFQPNLPLILEALEYIRVYPEVFHHPLEERAFDYLLQHNMADPKVIEKIRDQHSELEEATGLLHQQFEAIANGCFVPMERIKRDFNHYLESQLDHLTTENEKIFPALAEIEDSIWWDIASCMVIRQDPLFCDDSGRQYFNALAKSVIAYRTH